MKFRNLFESEKERRERLENEKFDVQIKTDMKVRQLEKEVRKIQNKAQDAYQRAEAFRAARNRDGAFDAYQEYQFNRSLRRSVNKSLRMMQRVTTMVKTGNLSNDVFTLLKSGLETSQFDPAAIRKIIAGNERLKGAFEAVGEMMDTSLEEEGGEMSAEEWFNKEASAGTEENPRGTEGLDAMKAEFEKIKNKG